MGNYEFLIVIFFFFFLCIGCTTLPKPIVIILLYIAIAIELWYYISLKCFIVLLRHPDTKDKIPIM